MLTSSILTKEIPTSSKHVSLPSIDGLIVFDPLDVDSLVRPLGSDGSAVDAAVLHVVQRLPDLKHSLLTDLDHYAVLDDAEIIEEKHHHQCYINIRH